MLFRLAGAVLMLLLGVSVSSAVYTTPGTGVNWTMDDLVANSAGAVTGGAGAYAFHQSVVVSVNDRLTVAAGAHLTFLDTTGTIGLEVRGTLDAVGTQASMIVFDSATSTPGAWRGLNCNDTVSGSSFHLAYCEIAHPMIAVDVVGAPVVLESCDLHDCLNKVLDFSAAGGEIRGCRFHDNRRQTIVMTLSSSPVIQNCMMENNNIENSSPYPYVNIGLQGVNSPVIRGCSILGSGHQMSGGIALWNSSNGIIEGNRIEGCGYGILCYQTGANPLIRANTLIANRIHPDTLNWGFGIACNGNNAPIVTRNDIRQHWYGIAIINGGHPNVGNLENAFPGDDGGNSITDNGLSRIYGLYNNTPLAQMAQGNWWGGSSQQEVEDAIFHQPDNPALGLVDYANWLTVDAVDETIADEGLGPRGSVGALTVRAVPNPSSGNLRLQAWLPRAGIPSIAIFDAAGRVVRELRPGALGAGSREIAWDGMDRAGAAVPTGVYYYRCVMGAESAAGKAVVVSGGR